MSSKSILRVGIVFLSSMLFWAYNAQSITDCPDSNCQICLGGSICVMCQGGYMLHINKEEIGTSCIEQTCSIANCDQCLNKHQCAICAPNYALDFDGECYLTGSVMKKNIKDGCAQFFASGQCAECLLGFSLTEEGCVMERSLQFAITVTCNIQNCTNCITPNFCGGCPEGNMVNYLGTACISSPSSLMTGCSQYISSTSCGICNSGYQLISNGLNGNTCILCQISGCQTCSSTNMCGTCMPGYNNPPAANGTCSVNTCTFPCQTCQTGSNTLCSTCSSPFSSSAATNGTCYTCSVANCLTCTLDTNGYASICTACYPPFVLNQNTNVCVNGCSDGCMSCSNSTTVSGTYVCTACYQGYMLNSTTQNCDICDGAPLCLTCNSSDANQCTACISGYFIETGNCIPCVYGCAICTGRLQSDCSQFLLGQVLTYQNGSIATQPSMCDQGCHSCLSYAPFACKQCQLGFFLAEWTCLPCDPSCASCVPYDPKVCLSCYSNGYYNSTNQTCQYCNKSSNCLTCNPNNFTLCTTCPYGFMMNIFTLDCNTRCPQDCLTCTFTTNQTFTSISNSNFFCTSCETGYVASWYGVCLPCVANCRICSGSAQGTCLSCGLGYYLSNGVCVACTEGCQQCNSQGCNACAPQYHLIYIPPEDNSTIGNLSCAINCELPCLSCQYNNNTVCTSCYYGYDLQKVQGFNTCVSNSTNCSSTNGCYVCPAGQVLSSGQCISCSANCAKCQNSAIANCTSCYPGFYINSTQQCVPCPENCTVCTGQTNCVTCAYGYVSFTQPIPVSRQYCLPCSPPCQTCAINPDTCTSCISGFQFTGWSCVSTFYYYFMMDFSASASTFLANYVNYLNQTAAAMQTKNYKVMSIQSIISSPNTTQIISKISTLKGSQDDNTRLQYQNLQFSFTGRGHFANMAILNQSLSPSKEIPTVSHAASYFSALFIPLGFLVLGGIGYYILSRNDMDLPGARYTKVIKANGNAGKRDETEMVEL